jgi:hypothetical protein
MRMSRDTTQLVSVRSEPPGRTRTFAPGGAEATTPTSLSLDRKSSGSVNVGDGLHKNAAYIVTVSMPGYADVTVPLESAISTDTWVKNLIWVHPLFFGLGVLVDTSSGAGYEIRPSDIAVELHPVGDVEAE